MATTKRLIWDLPTRLFHWAFAVSTTAAFLLAEFAPGDSPLFSLHMLFGVSAGLLLIWRIYWGLFGSRHARFGALFFSPSEVIGYFKSVVTGRGQYHAGHNPGGSVAIWLMLGLVGAAVLSGLSMGFFGETFEEVHEVVSKVLLFVVIAHVAGVALASLMNKENYVASMFTGTKRAEAADAIPHASPKSALAMVALFIVFMGYFAKGFDLNTATFTAPGTSFSVTFGEQEGDAQASEEGGQGEAHEEDDED